MKIIFALSHCADKKKKKKIHQGPKVGPHFATIAEVIQEHA